MLRYVLRRVVSMVPVLIGTTGLIFATVYALPGDPLDVIAGRDRTLSDSVRAELTARYHLDQSLPTRYWEYLTGLLRGDFGVDIRGTEVADLIGRAWPATLTLGLTAWVLMAVLGVGLGTLAGLRPGGAVDWFVLASTTLVLGIPYFVLAYVAQIVFGIWLGWLPTSGIRDGWPVSYLLPASCLAIFGVPELARLTRAAVLENSAAAFVDTAIAQGLSPARIAVRHVLRTSLVPVVSVLGYSLGLLLGGTVLIEGIFNIPGLGYTMYNAISQQNSPVVVGVGTVLVLVFLVVNLLVDLLYGLLDPRVSLDRPR